MEKANIFENMPENMDNEVFEVLAKSNNLKIERIISRGHCSPEKGWYDQIQAEWVIILKGEARIAFENNEVVYLRAGDYINISPRQKHRVAETSTSAETIWLAVHYG